MSSPLETTQASVWLAQGSLLAMALVPIFVGAFSSVEAHKKQLTSTGEVPTMMTQKKAAMSPLINSCGLFGLYILLKLLSKEHISLLLTVPITILMVVSLTKLMKQLVTIQLLI